jgi:lysophospholipase L1-like esterase
MLPLLGALAVSAAAPIGDPASCEGLCQAESLAPFLERLNSSRGGGGPPLHILQIGDSHSAGDLISNAWRRRLQARLGFGGRGVLPAGRPYPGYLTWGVTASQSGGWRVNATFGPDWRDGGPPNGLAGFTQTARGAGATLGLVTDGPEADFDRIVVCAILQPGGATVRLRMGAAEESWSLDAPSLRPACRTMDSDGLASSASITILDGGIAAITSFATFNRAGGAVLSNLGVVGSQFVHFARTDDEVLRAELAVYDPDLIVLAFGTNEAFSPNLTPDAYEADLRGQVARLRRLAGSGVPILLLGAPDSATRQPGLADPAEACGGGWSAPRLLGAIRRRQLAVARDLGLAFWNWWAAMGGRCAASRWARDGLMRADHVHFTAAGAERIGAAIDADVARAAAAAGLP